MSKQSYTSVQLRFCARLFYAFTAAFCFMLLSAVQISAQAPTKEWDATFGGTGTDRLVQLSPTPDGGYILGGGSNSDLGGNKTTNGWGNFDYWVVKTNANGEKEWEVSLGGNSAETFRDIQPTRDGGYIVGGTTASGQTGDITDTSRGGTYDLWIVKLSSTGAIEWNKRFGTSCDEGGGCVRQTNDGGFIIGGYTSCGPDGDKTAAAQGGNDYWIIKTDSLGNKEWDAAFGGPGGESLFALEQTRDGGYILGGGSSGASGGHKTQNAFNGSLDYWVIKIDANRNKEWDKTFGGDLTEVFGPLQQTADSGYIIGGFSDSYASGNKTTNAYNSSSDYWVIKLNASGNMEWQKQYGTYSEDQLYSVRQTPDGGYILGGVSLGGPPLGGDRTSPRRGTADYWVVKTNALGTKQLDIGFGGDNYNVFFSLELTPDGGYILGGYTNADSSLDKTQDSLGANNYWIVKLAGNITPGGWTGAVNNDWNEAGNWSDGVVPDSTADVTIGSGNTNYPELEDDIKVNNLTVESGATLIILSDKSLTVNGVLTNDGTIIVEDGGSLVQKPGSTLAGTGSYQVKRNITGGISFGASPINNMPVNGFGITPTGPDGGQILPNQNNPCNPNSVDASSPFGIIQELRENPDSVLNNCAQSLWHVKSAGTLENGRGYAIREKNPMTLNFVGTVNNGDIVFAGLTRQAGDLDDGSGNSTTISRGWHLVGNPYPSPIEIDGQDLVAMGFDGQVHRYNHGLWEVRDPMDVVVIPVGQSFQIRKSAVGGSVDLTFTNAMRVVGNPPFYKPTATREQYLNITLKDAANRSDKAMVYFMNDATDGFDARYDANRLTDGGPMVYTLAAGERLSYNALKTLSFGDTKTVPLSVKAPAAGSYTLTFHDVNTVYAAITLEDKKLQTTQLIKEGEVYAFSVQDGDSRDRFLLHFHGGFPTSVSSTEGVAADVSLFPNPTTGSLTLLLGKDHGYDAAVISDLSGKMVMNQALSSSQMQTIDVRVLPKGVYFIRLSGSNSVSLKFIKQ